MKNAAFPAEGGELFFQPPAVRAGKFVAVSVGADVPLFHAGEKPVKLPVKIFPVAFPEGESHAERDDALHSGLGAVTEDAGKVFFRVVDEGQDGAEPHHRGDSFFPEYFQGFKAFPRGARVWFQFPAQRFVVGGERHLNNSLCGGVDFFEHVQIPQHQGGFCDKADAEAVPVNQLKRFPGEQEFFFQRHVRVAHGAGSDHAFFPFAFQGGFEQLKGVFFYGDVLELVVDMVTAAPRIAVNAAVGASPVQVHAVVCRENVFCLNEMHGVRPHVKDTT